MSAGGDIVLVTGGAGFIGTNLAHRLLGDGRRVRIYDDLSRAGVQRNLAWLQSRHGDQLETVIADVRDREALRAALRGAGEVYHLAAQVAVTSSLVDPLHDFEVNARGTLNLLECMRELAQPPALLYTSTNKVYGALPELEFAHDGRRWQPADAGLRARGIDEQRALDFHSPYGCSKGTADQYVIDYARCYGLANVVLRMSCIYGPHQCGNEDQGWVAHFLRAALAGHPLTLHGDGHQVRDVLYVEDLVAAFLAAMRAAPRLAGHAFNIGGGPGNAISLRELLEIMERDLGLAVPVRTAGWRRGDQRWYVADTGRFTAATGWAPCTGVRQGLRGLLDWAIAEEGGAHAVDVLRQAAALPSGLAGAGAA